MTTDRARSIARLCRHNIGYILNKFKELKQTREDYVQIKNGVPEVFQTVQRKRTILGQLLQANRQNLRKLYIQYPDIKPERGRQLSLSLR